MLDSDSTPNDWIESAAGDFAVLQAVLSNSSLPRRVVCFMSHLVVEKSLKATIAAAGARVLAWHDLLSLHDTCADAGRPLNLDEVQLRRLGPWAIKGRYDEPTNEPSALFAEEVAAFAAAVLGRALKEHLPQREADDRSGEPEREADAQASAAESAAPLIRLAVRPSPTLVPGTDSLVAGLRRRESGHGLRLGPLAPGR
jgi:HEPN domain-containing protein